MHVDTTTKKSNIEKCPNLILIDVPFLTYPYLVFDRWRRGQELMRDIRMDRVYDYMFHLLVEYSVRVAGF